MAGDTIQSRQHTSAQDIACLLYTSFRVKARLLLPDDQDRFQTLPPQPGQLKVDVAITQWSFDRNEAAGLGTDTLPGSSVLYLPLKAPLRMLSLIHI